MSSTMFQTNIIQDKRNIQNDHQTSFVYSNTSHSSKKKRDDSLTLIADPLRHFISSSDICQNSNDIIDELDMPLSNNILASAQGEKHGLYCDDQDIGFDFEESNQVITNFQDLPVQCDLSDDSSIDSFLLAHGRDLQHKEEFQVIKGEASTCSTSESLSEDDESVSYPTRSSLFHASCIKNHDTQQQQQQQETLPMRTSCISLPSTPPTSILNPRKHDKLSKRSVSFSPCLVTEIHTMPRRSCQEWHRCYYTAHELQRMLDENDRDEWMAFGQRGQTCWGRQGRQLVITAQEEDDDVLEF